MSISKSGWSRKTISFLKNYRVEIAIFIGVGIFYIYSLQPSLNWGDGARMQIEAISGQSFVMTGLPDEMFAHDPLPFAKLGIAAWDHPLYVYIGYSLVQLFPEIDALLLVNLISAIFGAATIAIFYRISHNATGSSLVSIVASLALGVSHTFWFHASTAEVYTLLSLLLLLSFNLFNEYLRSGKTSRLAFAGIIFGLAAANHLLAFLFVIAYLIYIPFSHNHKNITLVGIRKLLVFVGGFILGFLPFLIQFVRMLRIFSLADVLVPAFGATFLNNSISFEPQILLKGIATYGVYLIIQFNPILLVMGFIGLFSGRIKYREFWGKLIPLYAIFTLFGVLYQVVDQFAFFMMSHIFFAFAIGLGLDHTVKKLPPIRKNILISLSTLLMLITPTVYAGIPDWVATLGITDETLNIPQVGVTGVRSGIEYYINPNKRGDWAAYQFGEDTFLNLPPDALIISEWYTDLDEYLVFNYFSSIEGRRPDIEIFSWLTVDPFSFDAQIVVDTIESQISIRPVYLASLSEEFYNASYLIANYCIYPHLNLYRIVLKDSPVIPFNTKCITNS